MMSKKMAELEDDFREFKAHTERRFVSLDMSIRAYRLEEDQRHEEEDQMHEERIRRYDELKNLLLSLIQKSSSPSPNVYGKGNDTWADAGLKHGSYFLFDRIPEDGQNSIDSVLNDCWRIVLLAMGKHTWADGCGAGLKHGISYLLLLYDVILEDGLGFHKEKNGGDPTGLVDLITYLFCGAEHGSSFRRLDLLPGGVENNSVPQLLHYAITSNGHLQCCAARLPSNHQYTKKLKHRDNSEKAAEGTVVYTCDAEGNKSSSRKVQKAIESCILKHSTDLSAKLLSKKSGFIDIARDLFDKMLRLDCISWGAIISGYAHLGHNEEALRFFVEMKRSGEKANRSIFSCILSTCAEISALELGFQLHAQLVKVGLRSGWYVGNALLSMYCKCGNIDEANALFEETSDKDIVSWNTIIAGYARHGFGQEALRVFESMKTSGVKPDQVTMVGMLSACSHSGHR
ncbi:pentatricopeptide repeat-containing protein [Tanacetum coccineum]